MDIYLFFDVKITFFLRYFMCNFTPFLKKGHLRSFVVIAAVCPSVSGLYKVFIS